MELYLFKNGLLETLDSELGPLSQFYNLYVLALTESVAWVDGLIKFIDDTYNEYSRSKYSPKKVWHITTRLAKALIEKVASPRNSIHNSFSIRAPSGVAKSITYASLRSLDLMTEILSLNFKNFPIITSDLSKFLALNTNVEGVEKMQKQVNTLESEHLSLKKDLKNAALVAATASDKWDSFKPTIDGVKKRRE